MHECERVFADRLLCEADGARFDALRLGVQRRVFDDFNQAELEARPLLFASLAPPSGTPVGPGPGPGGEADEATPPYAAVPGHESLKSSLEERLAEYNESSAVMDLVRCAPAVLYRAVLCCTPPGRAASALAAASVARSRAPGPWASISARMGDP